MLLRECRNTHSDSGQVNAFIIRNLAADDYISHDLGFGDFGSLQGDLAVVDEQLISNFYVLGQSFEGGGANILAPFDITRGDSEGVPVFEQVRSISEPAESNYWSLRVGKHGDRVVSIRGG